MKKATLNVGLQSEQEDWFTSVSIAESISRDWLCELSNWTFEAACRRLRDGGWGPPRMVTVSVMSHADVTRLTDGTRDVETRFVPDTVRRILEHLFAETMALIYRPDTPA